MSNQREIHSPSVVHRIDRLTSGLLLMAKTKQIAHEIANAIQKEEVVRKTYLAKVWGKIGRYYPKSEEN